MATEEVEEAMSPSLQSTLQNAEDLLSSSEAVVIRPPEVGEPPHTSSFSPQSSPVSVKAAVRAPADVKHAAKVENLTVVSWIPRQRWLAEAVRRADVAVRIAATSLCLISISVMAADKDRD